MPHSTAPLTILVVDDVPQNLLAMQALLAGEWQQVLTAGSGAEALELLLKHDVAIALLDVQMPGMDGYTLAELMRGTERTRHIPIVFLTAGNREDQRTFRGYEAGAVDFLYKPVDPYVLRSKVEVFLDLHRQRQRLAVRVAENERLARVHARVLTGLSNDLREPLAALNLNAEALLRRQDPALASVAHRIKAAASMIGRQIDHLINLGQVHAEEMRPEVRTIDIGALLGERLQASQQQGLWVEPVQFETHGDLAVEADPVLLGDAFDQLLLHFALHAGHAAMRVVVDGNTREAVVLTWQIERALGDAARQQMFGGPGEVGDVPDVPQVGPALQLAERTARAHGGSLIGRTHARDGTLVEMMLPRLQGAAAAVG